MKGNRDSLFVSQAAGSFQQFLAYMELCKLHLCIYISLSGVFGYVAGAGGFRPGAAAVGAFICLLSAGAAVLNNIQDREYDRFFVRTCNRSLPKNKVQLVHAMILSAILICTGLSGLFVFAGWRSFALGAAALTAYNALYTPLKKKTFFAMIPGSLCGMIVPAIGWSAAQASLKDPGLVILVTVFGLWQMAHFFIILMRTRHKMLNLPGAKRFVNFYDIFSSRQMKFHTMVWTGLYALGIMLFTIGAGTIPTLTGLFMTVNPIITWLIIFWIVFIRENNKALAFAVINLSILAFMGTFILHSLFGHTIIS